MIQTICPQYWEEYELIDSGNFEKLERFGKYIVSRPEPQAVWDKYLSQKKWEQLAHANFKKGDNKKPFFNENNERGKWILKPGVQEQWWISYHYKEMHLKFRLGLTSFKHVGIFPEQAENWNYIYDTLNNFKGSQTKVLNLFAYTGGASLAARHAGANVVHVDSVKQVITWTKENMESSRLSNIQWVVEDAVKFVKREVKRGSKYNGIILDPPAYGRGPAGEKWTLEGNINELLKLCSRLLLNNRSFLVLNLYSIGFSALIAENLIKTIFNSPDNTEIGELYQKDQNKRKLPLGIFARFKKD